MEDTLLYSENVEEVAPLQNDNDSDNETDTEYEVNTIGDDIGPIVISLEGL